MNGEANPLDEPPSHDAARFPAPRVFQDKAHESLRDGAKEGHKRQILMAPTGAGKTYLGLRAIHESLAKSRRAMFLCDRITLINQTSETADRYGLASHGIMQANHWRFHPSAPFQIASAQTLMRRRWPDDLDLLIVDECHTQLKVWTDYIESFDGHVIGLSATPFSKGLGKLFTNLVNAATMAELVDLGVLVPLRVFSCTKADMKGAATSGGEWTEGAAAERGLAIVGDVVSEWSKYAEGRKTIIFGATIAHCEEICKQFNQSGVMAAVFCATTTASEREEILKEYRRPDAAIRVLVSVEALAKGFDVPDVGCIVDCRPLRKSLSTFIQMIGRGLRSSPDKADCILLDHSGNIVRFADDFSDIYFNGLSELDTGEKLDKAIRQDGEEKDIRSCPKCGYSPFGKRCISCGYEPPKAPTIEHEASGGMREIMIGKTKAAEDRRDLWNQICTYSRRSGNPETAKGRAAHLYKDIMGAWPPDYFGFATAPEVTISKPLMGKIQSRRIAWAKGLSGRARA